jgi:hypothetical protein
MRSLSACAAGGAVGGAVAESTELPGLGEIGRELVERVRERPLAASLIALAAGYLLGGGFFSRSTRWLARAALGALAVPAVREQVFAAARSMWPRQSAAQA